MLAAARRRIRLLYPFVPLAIAGCGGGGGAPIPPVAGTQHYSYGIVSADALGGATPKVVTNSSAGPVVTGIAGAAFVNISISPARSVSATQIAFTRSNSLYTINSDGSNMQVIPGIPAGGAGAMHPRWSRDGRLVFYARLARDTIYVCNRDGSNLHGLYPGVTNDYDPSWSPDNTRIAFTRSGGITGHTQIYVSWSDGTGLKQLSDGTSDDSSPCWSPDSKKIYFRRVIDSTHYYIYSMPSTGGAATLYSSAAQEMVAPVMSPDGNRLLCGFFLSSSEGLLEVYPGGGTNANDTNNVYENPCSFSPDGSSILYQNLSGSTSQIMEADLNLNGPVPFLNYNDTSLYDASWEPFMGTVPMVAQSGTPMFGRAASGFLFGLNGEKVASFATFTTKTPTTATLTADPVSGSSTDIVYHLGGDAITNISYANAISSVPVSLLTTTATARGAVLDFDATTGAVALVLPYTKARPHGVAQPDGTVTYKGEFLGVYARDGKNLAPSGAGLVRMKPKSGQVIDIK